MDFFQTTMRVLSALLMLYFFIIMIRIILSWVPDRSDGVAYIKRWANRITDPYMNYFQRISWLRMGMLDFSPILGVVFLSFLLFITQRLSMGVFPGIGELLIWVIQTIWGTVAFLVLLMSIVMLIRLVTLHTMRRRPEWTDHLDRFLFPRISKILGLFTRRAISYSMALGMAVLILLGMRFFIGWILVRFIYPLLFQI